MSEDEFSQADTSQTREFSQNNVFGASALTSYGGFWISIGIILTPGGFNIAASYPNMHDFYEAFGLYIFVSLGAQQRLS